MAEILDDVTYLSQEIGPRPAGTEEEQQAALYIADQVHKRTHVRAEIENINCIANPELINVIYFGISFVAALVSMIFPVAAVVALVLTLLSALGWLCEEVLNKPLLSRALARDISQNVVVKCKPATPEGERASHRKIIVVANYDSGKVMKDLKSSSLTVLGHFLFAADIALLAAPVILLFKDVIFLHSLGFVGVFFMVLLVADLVLLALPLVRAIMHRLAAYNEAANCNASGVAVLLEVIRRVGGSGLDAVNEESEEAPVVHGEEVARKAGVVEEGIDLTYAPEAAAAAETAAGMAEGAVPVGQPQVSAAEQIPAAKPAVEAPAVPCRPFHPSRPAPAPTPETPESAEERLRAAKAAIAAITGEPVSEDIYADNLADNLVQVGESEIGQPTQDQIAEQRADLRSALGGTQEAVAASTPESESVALEYGEGEGQQPAADFAPEPTTAASMAREVSAPDFVAAAPVVPEPAEQPSVPAWFKSAQEKANKSAPVSSVHRSRYADALDSAVKESSVFFNQANQLVDEETETRLRQMRKGISEVKAPVEEPAFNAVEQQAAALAESAPAAPAPMQTASAPVEQATASAPAAPVKPVAKRPEPAAAQPAQKATPAAPVSQQPVTDKTVAMPPIDVSDLRPRPAAPAPSRAEIPAAQPQVVAPAPAPMPVQPIVPVEPAAIPVPSIPEPTMPETVAPLATDDHLPQRVVLPEIAGSKLMAPIADSKQRAPLAVATEEDGKSAAKSLLSHTIPKIDAKDLSGNLGSPLDETAEESVIDKRANLITNLPSLSGSISSTPGEQIEKPEKVVSATGSFAAVSANGTFAPVGDELVADMNPEDMYVDDADDSGYEGGVTETGAFAGPGYVSMPESRAKRFFGRFRRKKNRDEDGYETPQEWLNVDDEFDARSVGRERGDWSSFQQGSQRADVGSRTRADEQDADPSDEYPEDGYDEYYEEDYPEEEYGNAANPEDNQPNDSRGKSGRRWNGGAFSRRRKTSNDDDIYEDYDEFDDLEDSAAGSYDEQGLPEEVNPAFEDYGAEDKPARKIHNPFARKSVKIDEDDDFVGHRDNRTSSAGNRPARHPDRVQAPMEGEAAARRSARPVSGSAPEEAAPTVQEERDDIYAFASEELDTEVWFVALGAEMSNNTGIKAFMAEHAEDMHGAVIVSVEGVGAGHLCSVGREGIFKKVAPSTRLKRFLRGASQISGISLGQANMAWRNSTASCVMSHGGQAISLVGVEGDKPAFYAQSDDVCENLDEGKLQAGASFVMELLRTI